MSANSSGECDTPVGLRTNTMAEADAGELEDAGVVPGSGRDDGSAIRAPPRAGSMRSDVEVDGR